MPSSILSPQRIEQIRQIISARYDELFETFQYLNQHPEILFDLPITSAKMKACMESIEGMDVHEGIAPSCLVGVMKNGPGPVIAYRTDLDGLNIEDKTTNPWRAVNGRSHSCGHSTHMTIGLAVCRVMSELRAHWSGTFLFYAQACEEGGTLELGSGAQCMIRNGLFTRFPRPEKILAIHVDPFRPAGLLRVRKGPAFAHTSFFILKVKGKAAHGGMPFKNGVDSIVMAARIVEALQGIVSRELNPQTEPAVVTIGAFHAGDVPNAIPAVAELKGTVRCFSEKVYEKICQAIKRIADGQAASMGMPQEDYPELILYPVYAPQLINDVELGNQLERVYRTLLPAAQVEESDQPEFYGEDFANYGATEHNIALFLTWVGSVNPTLFDEQDRVHAPLPPLHDGRFSPYWNKEAAMDTFRCGALTQACAVLDLMDKP